MRFVAITFHVNLRPVRLNAWQSELNSPLISTRGFDDTRRMIRQTPAH